MLRGLDVARPQFVARGLLELGELTDRVHDTVETARVRDHVFDRRARRLRVEMITAVDSARKLACERLGECGRTAPRDVNLDSRSDQTTRDGQADPSDSSGHQGHAFLLALHVEDSPAREARRQPKSARNRPPRSVDQADATQGPDSHVDLAAQILRRDEPELAAVRGVAAIVAENEGRCPRGPRCGPDS